MSHLFKDPMPPLRRRMIEDMVLAGLARRTQLNYLYAVRRLAAEFHRSPDLLTEEDVRGVMTRVVRSCTTSVNETRKQFFGPARSGGSAHFLVGCTGVSDAHDRLAADF